MTDKEIKTIALTMEHKESFARHMSKFFSEMAYRTAVHDNSKFKMDELNGYSECANEFNTHPFDSPGERALREKLAPVMTLHKTRNRHHPEYHADGIDGMDLMDLLEMLCDWKSASERTPGDSLKKALPILQAKYNITPQLLNILENTLKNFNLY